MSTVTLVVADVPPPDAVTVIVRLPVPAEFDADTFIVVVPAADSELGENVTVSPLPVPEAENVTVPVVVPESVIVELPDDPRVTVSELGEAEIVYFDVAAVTVRFTVVELDRLPLVPVIVIEYVPDAVPAATVNVAVEVDEPLIDVGLKLTVTPEGAFEDDSETDDEKPPVAEIEIEDVPLPPVDGTETELGLAATVKPGVCVCVPASALISADCGLPHPVTRSYPVTAE
jgi:hypothetical protein